MDAIDQLLTRGVDTIYPSRETLEKVLRSGKKITLYQGFDPTGTRLHIGHSVAIRKLRQFQDLGHKVIFLIGDFTAMIGDPSGKAQARPILTHEQVLENAKEYKRQVTKILKFDGDNPVEIKFNNDWLSKLTLADVINLASHFTVQQMIERDMFQVRIKNHDEISLHEFLYPLMVGYDSVAMNVDLELGGTDQTFNMLGGRKLVSQMLHKEKFVMTVPLLTDSKGVKIGKTEGNVIGLTDPANDFYTKIMSLGDDAIVPCFTLLTDFSNEDIAHLKELIESGENPMRHKKKLAFELTKMLNSEEEALKAQEEFETRSQKGDLAHADLPTLKIDVSQKPDQLSSFLVTFKLASSKSEAKRLIEQKAVEWNGEVIAKDGLSPKPSSGDIIKVGKKKYLKLI
ncbi:tyrosine--tRNA ligase [Candidatus Gottesmanbacteria bacterium]|nr:tyrosine--tRNA ligase [Candidatus Gottesmanbacteria bacterium]